MFSQLFWQYLLRVILLVRNNMTDILVKVEKLVQSLVFIAVCKGILKKEKLKGLIYTSDTKGWFGDIAVEEGYIN